MYDKKIRNLTMHGAKSLAFECFAAELFRSNNYTVISEYNIDNKYVDIVLFRNDIMDYVCEIKYFSNIDVSPYILKKAVCQLQTVSLNSSKKMLIINSICDNNTKKNIIISQPGIRYSQAIALINSLLLDEKFFELSLKDKDYIISRINIKKVYPDIDNLELVEKYDVFYIYKVVEQELVEEGE